MAMVHQGKNVDGAPSFDHVVRHIWMADIENGHQPTLQRTIDVVSADPTLVAQAIEWAVRFSIRKVVDNPVRSALLGTRAHDKTQLVKSLIDHGLSLMDARFGAKRLGDYLPSEALSYANTVLAAARTMLVRASFLKSVAALCLDPLVPIREQITPDQLEKVRSQIISRVPDRESAQSALAVEALMGAEA